MMTTHVTSNLGTNLEKLSREKLIIAIKEIANKNIFIEAEVEKIVDKILQDENGEAKNKTQNNNVVATSCTLFPNATISRTSSPNEKIALFKNLFRGRDDVFALRWQNEKGQNGYSPVCKNKWVQGKCNIKKVPCAVCAFRELENLNDERIFNHLAGRDALCRDVLGIYPLLQNDKCNFLAIDFDEKDFKADALSAKKNCDENKIPCALEISRSGNGCHFWWR